MGGSGKFLCDNKNSPPPSLPSINVTARNQKSNLRDETWKILSQRYFQSLNVETSWVSYTEMLSWMETEIRVRIMQCTPRFNAFLLVNFCCKNSHITSKFKWIFLSRKTWPFSILSSPQKKAFEEIDRSQSIKEWHNDPWEKSTTPYPCEEVFVTWSKQNHPIVLFFLQFAVVSMRSWPVTFSLD